MQIDLPAFTKTPSVRSFFDAVISASGQTRRLSLASSARSLLSVPFTGKDLELEVEDVESVPVDVLPVKTPEEEQTEIIERLVSHIVNNLMVDDNDSDKSYFLGSAIPPITLLDYLERLVKYVNQWDEDTPRATSTGIRCCLMAVSYLERSKVRVTPRSVHRYVMTAILVAIKSTEDFAISNKFWGDVGGCRLEDVNRMEIALCQLLQWNLTITAEEFTKQQRVFGCPCFA